MVLYRLMIFINKKNLTFLTLPAQEPVSVQWLLIYFWRIRIVFRAI